MMRAFRRLRLDTENLWPDRLFSLGVEQQRQVVIAVHLVSLAHAAVSA